MNAPTMTTPGKNAPDEIEQIQGNLLEKYPTLEKRADELIGQLRLVPDPVPEERIDEISELFVSCQEHLKLIESNRKNEKTRFDRLAAAVHSFFKTKADKLQDALTPARSRHGIAVTIRANRKQAEEEERKRKERAAAEEAARLAQHKLEAERAEAARLEAARQEAARKEAEAKAELERQAEARRLADEAAARKAQEELNQPDSTEGAAPPADPVMEATPAESAPVTPTLPPAPSAPSLQDRLAAEQRERIAALERKKLDEALDAKRDTVEMAESAAERSQQQATQANVSLQRTQTAPISTFARSRSNYGAKTTQQERWDFEILDRNQLPKASLWKYISDDALNDAVRRAVDAGVRDLKGVNIFRARTTQVRL